MQCHLIGSEIIEYFFNSSFAKVSRVFKSLWEAKRVVSSAKSSEKSFVAFGRSFMYIRNSKGPKMEPWGTPHATCLVVEAQSPI